MKLLLLLPLCGILSFTQASDKVIYNVQTQSGCTEVYSRPTRDCRWHADLDYFADQEIIGCKIIAYKLQWFNRRWSNWFVVGINDIDGKINKYQRQCNKGITIQARTMRRWWSYFYDHNHRYIKCCARKPFIAKGDVTDAEDEEIEVENENPLMNLIERFREAQDNDTQDEE